MKAKRARFKNLVVIWAQNAEVRAWQGVANDGSQGRKCADPSGILSKSEQREEAGRSEDKAGGVQESSGILGQKTQK